MARTYFNIPNNCSFEEIQNKIETILKNRKFHETTIDTGEIVWKNGTGFFTAMKFLKVEYSEKQVKLSAWTQAGLGSVGGTEMDLTGFAAAIPKKQLMNVVEEIMHSV